MTDSRPSRRSFIQQSTGAAAALALLPDLGLAGTLSLREPVRVGVVGVGRQGRAMLAELEKIEGLEVAAICDIDSARLRSGARRARGAKQYADHRAMLDAEPGLDAVLVATPTHRHRAIVEDALDAGRHVYCEAPIAHSIEDGQAIVRAARGSDRICMAGMQGRSNPVYKLARSFVVSGAIREVIGGRGQFHRKTSWRLPARDPSREKEINWRLDPEVSLGLAGEEGVQQFDVLHWFMNRYPERVSGRGSIMLHDDGREVADTIRCGLDFPGGVHVGYDATLANSYEGTYEQVAGTMGTVRLAWSAGWLFKEADAPTQGWEVYANRQQFHRDEGITLIADATKLAAQGRLKEGVGLPHPPLYYALADFVTSVAEGSRVPCTIDEGFRALVVAVAARDAVRGGTTVEIDRTLFTEG